MKITDKILSFPPYFSAPWSEISALRSRCNGSHYTLVITLKSGDVAEIPNLGLEDVNQVFDAHLRFTGNNDLSVFQLKLPLSPLDSLENLKVHNETLNDSTPLPTDALTKMATLLKALGLDDLILGSKDDCTCQHCQTLSANEGLSEKEESVTAEDLKFRDWDIKQIDNSLYSVANPLDPDEQYQVFLGDPVGCTCGNKQCEHIKAVLSS